MRMGTGRCCASDDAVTRVVLDESGMAVGIMGLQEIFESVLAAGHSPNAEGTAEELLTVVKARNYVSRSVEGQYRAALLREYASLWARRKSGA